MSTTDELLAKNERYARGFDKAGLPVAPGRKLAIVACMDSRLNLFDALGLEHGDAHVIRNAGGIVTEEEIRSLAISQNLLGTEEIIVINHTDCGLHKLRDEEFGDRLEQELGVRPDWPLHGFEDLDENVRAQVARIKESPLIPNTESVRGFVYDVETGRLREVR
jgi:carbonic anhydrase